MLEGGLCWREGGMSCVPVAPVTIAEGILSYLMYIDRIIWC